MARRRVAVGVVLLLGVVGCTELQDPNAADELSDFSTTSSSVGGMPYDIYLELAEQMGADSLGFGEAEERAALLCAESGIIEEPGSQDDWSATDRAIVRAYCPSVEVGS